MDKKSRPGICKLCVYIQNMGVNWATACMSTTRLNKVKQLVCNCAALKYYLYFKVMILILVQRVYEQISTAEILVSKNSVCMRL